MIVLDLSIQLLARHRAGQPSVQLILVLKLRWLLMHVLQGHDFLVELPQHLILMVLFHRCSKQLTLPVRLLLQLQRLCLLNAEDVLLDCL